MTGRFLKTLRFDASDTFAFPVTAEPGEWAVSCGFTFAGLDPQEIKGKTRQAFANGFLGVESFGYATFAAVATMTDRDRDAIVARLARHFVDAYGAPALDQATAAAREEVAFIEDLVKDSMINSLFCIQRSFDEEGQIVEAFRKLERRIDGGPIYL
ncbi:MAG: hypothetical protein KKB37_03000, partial [Alphaproteobacteria bacterium]|nr:hypothetical protein [Alphaproteobacteria bacterium]